MGQGIDIARAADPDAKLHCDVLEEFKEQLLVCLLKRLMDKDGVVLVPVDEVDATGDVVIAFAVRDRVFHFEVQKKQ